MLKLLDDAFLTMIHWLWKGLLEILKPAAGATIIVVVIAVATLPIFLAINYEEPRWLFLYLLAVFIAAILHAAGKRHNQTP